MSVRKLINDDWSFGFGLNNYINKDDEIGQNVKTRLKSFKFDWFLNFNENIDWLAILGEKNNSQTIEDEIRRVVLSTDGVVRITSLVFGDIGKNREVPINLTIDTVYGSDLSIGVKI